MELKREQMHHRAPKIGLIQEAYFALHGNAHMIRIVTPEHIEAFRNDPAKKDILGLPTYMAHDGANDLFMFWPAPDFDIEVKVRYYPPMEIA